MKKKVLLVTWGAFALVLVGGCGKQPQENQQASGSSSSPIAQNARATLTVAPGRVNSCEKGAHIDPKVSWQRIDTSIKNTKVTVSSPGGGAEKLFSEGGFQGTASAGDWVVAGVRFRLYDADSGVVLASYTIAGPTCPAGE